MIKQRFGFAQATALAIILLFQVACATVPLTNRKQIKLIPDAELLSMSFKEYNQVKKTSTLSTDRKDLRELNSVGKRISKAADQFMRENNINLAMNWEFILVEDEKVVNAWCMPGGKVAVYTGILPYTKNIDGLATVIGHEIAHAIAQHGNERLSQGLLVQFGGMALSAAMASKPEATRELWLQVFGIGASVGLILPYSRQHEYEADYIGLVLMAKAGFNPNEAVSFWNRMKDSGGAKPPEFLSTHPADEKRIAELKRHMPEAIKYYNNYR